MENNKQLIPSSNQYNRTDRIDRALTSFMRNDNSKSKLNKYFIIILLLILILFIWSLFATMSQTIQIKGQVTPLDGIAKVNHEFGGEITKVYVKNYDTVKQGDVLLTLDDKKILTGLKQYKSKLKVVDSEIAHSVSFLKNNLNVLKGSEDFEQVETYLNNISDTISQSAELTEATRLISDNQDKVIKSQIEINEIDLARLKQEVTVLQEQLHYLNQQRQIFNKLLETKNVSKVRAMDYEIRYRDVLITLDKTKADYDSKLKENIELKSKRVVNQQDAIKTQYQKLIDFNKEKIDLLSNIDQLENNLKNLNIKAPIDGIVQGTDFVTGIIVKPGADILSIIPIDSEMVFEAKASMQQKGKINLNDLAEIQFDGFNVIRYHRIPGEIINVSPYTFSDSPLQEHFIKVIVKLKEKEIRGGNTSYPIKPGMSGILYVTTDEQSIFAYIFGPIYDAFAEIGDQKT